MLKVYASQLNRIVACPGFVLMGGVQPPIERPQTELQREGIAAHTIAGRALINPMINLKIYKDQPAPNGVFITDDMIEHIFGYVNAIKKRGIGHVEIDTTFEISNIDMVIAGRADHIYYDPLQSTLYIDDFKYGWKLHEPFDNYTLIAYAEGYIRNNQIDPYNFVFTIHQPRPYHQNGPERFIKMDRATFGAAMLELKKALRKCGPKSQVNTGPHCSKCEYLFTCPAARLARFNAIEASSTIFNDNMTDQELSFHLVTASRALGVLNEAVDVLKENAQHRLKNGAVMPDFMLETTLSNYKWKSFVTPPIIAAVTGMDLTKTTLITPAQAKKRGLDEITFKALSERINTGTKLKHINVSEKARQMFGAIKT